MATALALVVGGVAVFLYVFALLIELAVSGSPAVRSYGGGRRERWSSSRPLHHLRLRSRRPADRREFRDTGLDYVVVDFSPESINGCTRAGDLVIEGGGTDSSLQAGLATARGLVASSDSDVDSLYVTLSARAARRTCSSWRERCNEDAAEKLRLAGADRVVQPYATAGLEMAKLAAKAAGGRVSRHRHVHSGPTSRSRRSR